MCWCVYTGEKQKEWQLDDKKTETKKNRAHNY